MPSTDARPADAGIDATGARVARRLLVVLAVLAALATVVALVLVQRLATTYRDGLEITRDGAGVAAQGTTSAAQLAGDVAEFVAASSDTLRDARRLISLGADGVDGIGTALGTNLATAVDGTSNIANGMAGLIEAIESFIPGDSHSLAEDLRAIADGLQPVPDQLRTLGEQLNDTADELIRANASLDTVTGQLQTLADSIDASTAALDRVDALAQDVAARADAALDRSDSDLLLLRVLIVVVGLGVVLACAAGHRAFGLGIRTRGARSARR